MGRTWGTVWYSSAAVNVFGNDAVGGLIGHQILNDTVASYATGNVEGMDAVGGLVGAVSDVIQFIEGQLCDRERVGQWISTHGFGFRVHHL